MTLKELTEIPVIYSQTFERDKCTYHWGDHTSLRQNPPHHLDRDWKHRYDVKNKRIFCIYVFRVLNKTHSSCERLQASSVSLHTQPSPLALAQTSQRSNRAQPSAWMRARDRGLPTRAQPWKQTVTLTNKVFYMYISMSISHIEALCSTWYSSMLLTGSFAGKMGTSSSNVAFCPTTATLWISPRSEDLNAFKWLKSNSFASSDEFWTLKLKNWNLK